MPISAGTTVHWINLREVEMKLAAAAPRILAENRAMVEQMLEMVKAEIEPVPGYRSSLSIEVTQMAMRSSGRLHVAMRGYWREFGTYGSFLGGSKALRGYLKALRRHGATSSGSGEAAGQYATKALSKVRGVIRLYYGKAQWWRL